MPGDDTDGVGFNPYRKKVVRRTDFVMLAAAVLVALALVGWAFLG
jgi:hypothetical protein